MARSTGPPPSDTATASHVSVTAAVESGFRECAEAQRIAGAGGAGAGRSGSGSGTAQDLARDHEPLDLARAFSDLHELGVAMHALDRKIAHVADAAVHLNRLVGHPVRGLARE